MNDKTQLILGIYVYIFVFLFHLIYIGVLEFTEKSDVLNKVVIQSECLNKVTRENNGNISWWPITHFIMYFILGVIAPKYWTLWFTIGAIWELFEYIVGALFIESSSKNKDENVQYEDRWMDGSVNDLIFNLSGLLLGICIHYLFIGLAKKKKN